MADNALNDFFAKKDKKKGGRKVTSAPAPAPVVPVSVAESPVANIQPAKSTKDKEDDDWVVPEEKVKDYTGLRIHELVIKSEDEEEKTIEYDVDTNMSKKKQEKKMWAATPTSSDAPKAMGSTSTWAYPTLAATKDMGKPLPPGMKGFDTVKRGYRGETLINAPKDVATSNKYAGLSNL